MTKIGTFISVIGEARFRFDNNQKLDTRFSALNRDCIKLRFKIFQIGSFYRFKGYYFFLIIVYLNNIIYIRFVICKI